VTEKFAQPHKTKNTVIPAKAGIQFLCRAYLQVRQINLAHRFGSLLSCPKFSVRASMFLFFLDSRLETAGITSILCPPLEGARGRSCVACPHYGALGDRALQAPLHACDVGTVPRTVRKAARSGTAPYSLIARYSSLFFFHHPLFFPLATHCSSLFFRADGGRGVLSPSGGGKGEVMRGLPTLRRARGPRPTASLLVAHHYSFFTIHYFSPRCSLLINRRCR